MATNFLDRFKNKNNQPISENNNTEEIILDDISDTEVSSINKNTTVGKKSIKINKLNTELNDNISSGGGDGSINVYEEGFVDDEYGFQFQMPTSAILENQRKEKFGLTYEQMLSDIVKREKDDLINLSKNVDQYYIEQAQEDLHLIYSILKDMIVFTADTYFSILNQMIKKIEKILASDDNFYRKSQNERANELTEAITKRLPSIIMKDFSKFVSAEKENPFGLFYVIYNGIKAQDFILTGNFVNVQYDNRNFFYVDLPNYLIEINNTLVNHMCVIYTYSKKLKFGPKNAMLDIEDQGFRFNFEHGSIVSTGFPVIFARKNVFGVAKLIENPNYYKDLLSEFTDKTDEEKDEIIMKMRKKADKGNFLVIGRTGSGKTTLLRQLLLDREKREQNLITIEDTKELNLPNAIAFLTNKDYGIHDIFKSTLRMNPSRIIVGETRDATILDILEVCLTSKSATTLHATDLSKAITRIRMMSKGKIKTQDLDFLITSAIDMFIFIDNRKITSLYIKNSNKDSYTGSNIFEAYERIL